MGECLNGDNKKEEFPFLVAGNLNNVSKEYQSYITILQKKTDTLRQAYLDILT